VQGGVRQENIMSAMNSWCIEHHEKKGLTAAVQKSTLTTRQAEVEILEFLKKFISKPKTAPLAGNSVHADRAFLVVSLKTLFAST
jgi:oligoribonuclease